MPGCLHRLQLGHVARHLLLAGGELLDTLTQGADIAQDIVPLLPLLHAVHIKDRVKGGGSRPLGTGDTNFQGFFPALLRAGFRGDFVLQHYFEQQPELETERSLSFVQQLIESAKAEAA